MCAKCGRYLEPRALLSMCHTQLNNWIEGTISEVNCNPIPWAVCHCLHTLVCVLLMLMLMLNVVTMTRFHFHFLLNDFIIIQIDVIHFYSFHNLRFLLFARSDSSSIRLGWVQFMKWTILLHYSFSLWQMSHSLSSIGHHNHHHHHHWYHNVCVRVSEWACCWISCCEYWFWPFHWICSTTAKCLRLE